MKLLAKHGDFDCIVMVVVGTAFGCIGCIDTTRCIWFIGFVGWIEW